MCLNKEPPKMNNFAFPICAKEWYFSSLGADWWDFSIGKMHFQPKASSLIWWSKLNFGNCFESIMKYQKSPEMEHGFIGQNKLFLSSDHEK